MVSGGDAEAGRRGVEGRPTLGREEGDELCSISTEDEGARLG